MFSYEVDQSAAPQGCCLSHVFLSLYHQQLHIYTDQNCSIIKYANDTITTGHIFNDTIDSYNREIQNFVHWA